jgi:pimeloyl-ACP methyl ester carboxylesterase
MTSSLTRRSLVLGAAATTMLAACATNTPPADALPPIVFVHGNGDTAALWITTQWRFESNGWPRERLYAVDMPYPQSRDVDATAQEGRSSTAESMQFLKSEVDKVLRATGASRVVLIANSRGGNAVRNYIANGGGTATVSHAILCGTPNHGVWADAKSRVGNEFNGAGPFLAGLNAPKGPNGDEVTPGVKWLTLRSDNNDKFAQPDGVWIGASGKATNATYDGPALKGATNLVLPRVDHRETSFSPAAFAATWQFLTGEAPRRTDVAMESIVVLGGRVTGFGLSSTDPASGQFANNLPLPGAQVAVFETDPATGMRKGGPAYRQAIGADGRWGPFTAQAGAAYEFEIAAPGYATTHIYRSPFPRSSTVVNLRPDRILPADREARAIVILTRPRGYFDAQRDTMRFDGQPVLPGVPPKGAGVSSSKIKLDSDAQRSIAGEFNGERVTGLTWPAVQGHMTLLELTY